MQIGGEALEAADPVGGAIGTDGDVMHAVADVDAGGAGMHHVQPGIVDSQPARQLLALLPIQSSDVCAVHPALRYEDPARPGAVGVTAEYVDPSTTVQPANF